jgi:uncharacterized protein (TIGR02145 family)
MSRDDKPTGLTVLNQATGQATIEIGQSVTLALAVYNNSGADIPLVAGASPCTLAVYLVVQGLFTLDQVRQMQVSTDGWKPSVDAGQGALVLTRTESGTWSAGAALTFAIAQARSSGPAGGSNVTVVPSNFSGDVGLAPEAPLAIIDRPTPHSIPLTDVLQITLDDQGSVLRSEPTDPLTNTLFLTLKNTGATKLATPTDKRPGNPQITVWFVYGNTSGALAPAIGATTPPVGSAWNIKVGVSAAQAPWTGANPTYTGTSDPPKWTLSPSENNLEVLGPAGSDTANVTFSFSPVVSFTPTGHTQMLVLCTGFARDPTTTYDPHLYVLDIVKQDPPPTRGLLSYFGPDPVIAVTDPQAPVKIPLRWAMFDVASIRLLTSEATIRPLTTRYPNPKPLAYDDATITLPPRHESGAIFTTLQAFDGNGAYLNSMQYTAFAEVAYVLDPAGQVYRTMLIGDTFWMLENYRFQTPAGSYLYNDDGQLAPAFGRLYEWAAAQAQIPDGWSLPTVADWQALIDRFGGRSAAFGALVAGGSSGFAAQLGGWRLPGDQYSDMYSYGYYWASAGEIYTQLSQASQSAGTGVTAPGGAALSVRYVQHA